MVTQAISQRLKYHFGLFVTGILVLSVLLLHGYSISYAQNVTIVVKPSTLASTGWGFVQESGATGAGDFVSGPGVTPLSTGSAHFTTGSSSDGIFLGVPGYQSTKLSDITALQYSTYQDPGSSSTVQAVSLQFAIDNDITDADTGYKGRLVFEPYLSETVVKGSWQTWDTLTQGRWWGTNSAISASCSQASPCTWAQVLAAFPNAGIHSIYGALLLKTGSGWPAGFDGNVDALTIGVSGNDTTYDFEPETPCTSVCYVDAVNGNDAFGGDTPTSAKKTIQAAIDAVDPGGQVRVLPGDYSETATNRYVLGANGPHQFGLFIPQSKAGISIIGVNSSDVPVTDYNSLLAKVATNATNNFGHSGVFVEADNVTIQGLLILPNVPGDDKTLEIIGDNFTLQYSKIDVDGGSVYFDDWQYNTGTNSSHIQSYHINSNWFATGTSLDITSGAGFSGPVSGRVIENNTFDNNYNWPSVSFSGSDTGVPWFVYSVGGAVIKNNTFNNTSNTPDDSSGHIRARGTYDNSQFDWTSYWNDNTFNRATVTLIGVFPPFDVRTYSYPNSYGTFDNVRRIGVTIQGEVNHAAANDTVLVNQGTYVEQVSVPLTLNLLGEDGALLTFIKAPASIPAASSADSNIVKITGAGVRVDMSGFTVTGPGPSGCGSIARGIFVRDDAYANIHDNRVLDVRDNPLSGCQNGIGIQVGSASLSTNGTADIENNTIANYQKAGIVVANSTSSAVITNNTITGIGPTTVIAQNGIQVSNGASADINGNTVSGHSYTPFTYVSTGMLLYGASNANTDGNTLSENQVGIYVIDTPGDHNGNTVSATSSGTGSPTFWGIIVDAPPPAHVPDPFDVQAANGKQTQAKSFSINSLAAVQKVTVTNNVLTGDTTAAGIGLEVDSGYGSFDIDLTVTNNFIQNWGYGFEVYECASGCTGTVLSNLHVNLNSITGNLSSGYDHSNATFTADGEKNWWGSISGPSGAGSGTGDSVSADVDFDPWLCYGTDTSPNIGFQPNLTVSPCVGSITIIKDATPADGTDFGFSEANGQIAPFSLDDAAPDDGDAVTNSQTFSGLVPGAYKIIEQVSAPWNLTFIVCDDNDGSNDLAGHAANINLQAGEHVTCTFTNTKVNPNPKIDIDKQTPDIAVGGGSVTYTYLVTNPGNVPLSGVTVTDDKCSPVIYQSGDDGDNQLEPGEIWNYTCSYSPSFSSKPLTNKATASGSYGGHDYKASDSETLYPFALKKKLYLYWQEPEKHKWNYSVPYLPADNTPFTVEVYKGNTLVGTFTISQNSPQKLWLSDGTFTFKEVNLPAGYLATSDSFTFTTSNGTCYHVSHKDHRRHDDDEDPSEWTFANVITFDLSIDKTGPATGKKGKTVTYSYTVTNTGPASVMPKVTDDKCSKVKYVGGDTDHDGRIDPGETWIFKCDFKVNAKAGTNITNKAEVSDKSLPRHWDLGGDVNPSNDQDIWTMLVIN